jgi:hypothetical protein
MQSPESGSTSIAPMARAALQRAGAEILPLKWAWGGPAGSGAASDRGLAPQTNNSSRCQLRTASHIPRCQ